MVPFWFTSLVVRREWNSDGTIADLRLRVHGPQPTTYTYSEPQSVELMGVEIAPEIATSLLRTSNDDLASEFVDWPSANFSVAMRMAADGANAEAVSTALMHQVATLGCPSVNDGIGFAIRLFRKSAGAIRVKAVCEHLEFGERRFRREFRSRIGISAKSYGRLLRANGLVAAADQAMEPDWADLAYRFGYFDQAHMSNDLRQLTGYSPQRLNFGRRNEAFC